MPIVGFTDAAGVDVPFADVLRGVGDWDGLPLPFVRMLAKQYRPTDHYGDDDTVSVTTIIAPIQQTRLLQRHDVFVAPLDNLAAADGTMIHALLEEGVVKEDTETIAEQKLVIERMGQKIGGTFDLLQNDVSEDPNANRWTGSDYKRMGSYAAQKMLREGVYKGSPDKFWQAQIYRLMCQEVLGVQVDRWQLVCWLKDWTASRYGDLAPVTVIEVPLLETSRVENYLASRILEWQAADMCDDDGLPECSKDETWGGRRCASYCAAAEVCQQLRRKA